MNCRRSPLLMLAACLAAAPATAAPARVAILPVVVHSLSEGAYLRDGLADMLASRIGQVPGLAVIRVEDASAATTEAAAAIAAARAVGADYVLFGSFTHFGEGASLDMQCAPTRDPDGARREIFVESGTLGEIIPRLDALTDKLSRFVTGVGAPSLAVPAPASTGKASEELQALRERVEALESTLDELRRAALPEVDVGGSVGLAPGPEPPPAVR